MSSNTYTNSNDVDLPDPDITWDLDRLKYPTGNPTPSPITPSPTTKAPTTIAPTIQATPNASYGTTVFPTRQAVASTVPSLSLGGVPDNGNDDGNDVTDNGNGSGSGNAGNDDSQENNGKQTRTTYFSCPAPPTTTITYKDTEGNPATVDISPPLSTITIDYDFELQLLDINSDINNAEKEEEVEIDVSSRIESIVLPNIQRDIGNAIAGYMRGHTENGEDEESCGGYYVEEWRERRKMNLRRLMNDGVTSSNTQQHEQQQPHTHDVQYGKQHQQQYKWHPPSSIHRALKSDSDDNTSYELTKIISVATTSSSPYTIDESQTCQPKNDGCYVIVGHMEATYVGYNEASVKSSISQMVKDEMSGSNDSSRNSSSSNSMSRTTADDADANNATVAMHYNMKYVGPHGDGQMRAANTPVSAIRLGDIMEAIPETDGALSPVGIGIAAVLAATLVMALYAVFVNDGRVEPIVDKVKEKSGAKKRSGGKTKDKLKPLGGDEDQDENDDASHAYDLEAVAIQESDDDLDTVAIEQCGDDEVEVTSVLDFSRSQSVRRSKSSSNRTNAKVAAAATTLAIASLAQAEASANGSSSSGSTRVISNKSSQRRSITPSSDIASQDFEASSSDAIRGSNALRPIHAGVSFGGSVRSSRSANEHERSTPIRANRSNTTSFGRGQPLVDRTPSTTSAASASSNNSIPTLVDPSPISPNSRLQTVPEANLPPPLHDTPHRSKYPILSPPSPSHSHSYLQRNGSAMNRLRSDISASDSVEVSEVVHRLDDEKDEEMWEV